MTVINTYFAGHTTIAKEANGVQNVRTVGDYLPMIVSGASALIAGAVTLMLMLSPVSY